ncbi:TIGR00730 family Rossman fold protein [Saccharopolyspora gloriosae]|uniref:LOG family protein n=1 Tax=Saccharopolyspora gloriosae TaxID=455344 RepID=UPI001FB6A15D|nr:TIGR00730 family Rossman fold protein [Saccharopolyspora gloriosae]
MHPLSVCVFCSASTSIPRTYQDLAAETGRGIAERGWTLVTGGEAVSMMGAVADAARAAGGRTVGVVPEALLHEADRDAGELVVLPSVSQRKATMITRSDALLALPGGVGTCDEIFESWTTRMLVPHSKPLVLLDHEGHFGELVSWTDRMHRTGFISHEWRSALRVATTVAEALDMCEAEAPVTT